MYRYYLVDNVSINGGWGNQKTNVEKDRHRHKSKTSLQSDLDDASKHVLL